MKNNYQSMSPFQLYDWLRAAYNNNGLYDAKSELLLRLGSQFENIKSLGSPVERSVEYFVSKILAGDSVNIVSDNQGVIEAIEQVYEWSNFLGKKSAILRDFSLLGDCFMKIRVTEGGDKVVIETINPNYVTALEKDARGNVIEIRIDIPYVDEDDNYKTYTEYWNKELTSVWEHTLTRETALSDLGTPNMWNPTAYYGLDFIPIIHIPFRDINQNRGQSCVYHALDKIDEMNRMMTRLHEQIFVGSNRAWFLDISKNTGGEAVDPLGLAQDQSDGALLVVNGTPSSAIPNLPYAALLSVLENMSEELIRDLPELRAYSLTETSGLSGKSIALLLEPAIERAEEAQSNFIRGLERANMVALTLGIFNGILPSSLGLYERGDFKHSVLPNDMRALPIDEKALGLNSLVTAGIPLKVAMQLAGFTQEEIDQTTQEISTTSGSSVQPVNGAVLPVA